MYIVEGTIGAGKSTFLTLLAKQLPFVSIAQEPHHHWHTETNGDSLLKFFYQDPHRWAYTIETVAMIYRVREHLLEQQHQNPYRVVERSVYSGHYVFAHNDFENGFMTQLEWELYNQWFNFLVPGKCVPPHGFIYLQTDPEVAYERIQRRKRASEQTVSLAYLKQLDRWYQKFLVEKEILADLKNIPVLTIDCNEDFENNETLFKKHCSRIAEFMEQTSLPAPRPTTHTQKQAR